jgi:hypothetical protein
MPSILALSEDPDWMFKPLGLSGYYNTLPDKNCGNGDED